jgi:hypothetical protein
LPDDIPQLDSHLERLHEAKKLFDDDDDQDENVECVRAVGRAGAVNG